MSFVGRSWLRLTLGNGAFTDQNYIRALSLDAFKYLGRDCSVAYNCYFLLDSSAVKDEQRKKGKRECGLHPTRAKLCEPRRFGASDAPRQQRPGGRSAPPASPRPPAVVGIECKPRLFRLRSPQRLQRAPGSRARAPSSRVASPPRAGASAAGAAPCSVSVGPSIAITRVPVRHG
jgi:hypothetical protein